jgi:hypothetical protein
MVHYCSSKSQRPVQPLPPEGLFKEPKENSLPRQGHLPQEMPLPPDRFRSPATGRQ